jgi:hypothetical protein
MSVILIGLLGLILALCLLSKSESESEGFRSSKCFSCEAQDHALGITNRGYGSKCFSCEAQDKAQGITHRGYGNKCLSCERPVMEPKLSNYLE